MSIRHGAQNAIAVLDKYYARTDDSVMYQAAMSEHEFSFRPSLHLPIDNCSVLHPKHKLEYFRNKKWEQDWIDTAINFMWKIWIEEYKGLEPIATRDLVQVCAMPIIMSS